MAPVPRCLRRTRGISLTGVFVHGDTVRAAATLAISFDTGCAEVGGAPGGPRPTASALGRSCRVQSPQATAVAWGLWTRQDLPSAEAVGLGPPGAPPTSAQPVSKEIARVAAALTVSPCTNTPVKLIPRVRLKHRGTGAMSTLPFSEPYNEVNALVVHRAMLTHFARPWAEALGPLLVEPSHVEPFSRGSMS